jgi:Dockerin type I domain
METKSGGLMGNAKINGRRRPVFAIRALVPSVICMLAATATGQVSTLSYTGNLASPQSVFEVTFTLAASDTVTFKTWSFGGGTNAAGQVIPAGGFDPLVALFTGSSAAAPIYLDSTSHPVADADNLLNASWSYVGNCPAAGTVNIGSNHDCGDDLMQVALPSGTYTLLLSDANYQPGAIYDGGDLSEPFVDFTGGGAQFQTCDPVANACISRDGHYAVDIISTTADLRSKCDVNQDGNTNVTDAQLIVDEGLGTMKPANDVSGDGSVNVVDVQIVINAALGLGCSAK